MTPPAHKTCNKIVDNEEEVVKELCKWVEYHANASILERGLFNIGLSGGSVAKFLCSGVQAIKTDWEKWVFFFCDERLVPSSDAESTIKLYLNGLLNKVPIAEKQFVTINPSLGVEEAAKDYEEKLKTHFVNCEWPTFDLLLLGMGPDGHTASLFPGHDLLTEDKLWIAAISNSPKPPPCRVTMTLPVINHSRCVIFAMAGKSKAEMVKVGCPS